MNQLLGMPRSDPDLFVYMAYLTILKKAYYSKPWRSLYLSNDLRCLLDLTKH